MAMDNCELKFNDATRTIATKNVTVKVITTLFNVQEGSSCWLKDEGDTYIFCDEMGRFPQLESFMCYTVEVSEKEKEISSDDASDEDFAQLAYKSAVSRNRKRKGKVSKGKGPRAVPYKSPALPKLNTSAGPSGLQGDSFQSWYFKVTIGELHNNKVIPSKNCMIRCTTLTTCSMVKEELCREFSVGQSCIKLYDSDYLEITDSPGRVGRYWSGTRKIFGVVQQPVQPSISMIPTQTLSKDDVKELIEPLMIKMDIMEKKLDKANQFSLKGSDSVYKDIAHFIKDMLKCAICCDTSKDEVPHATACCNQVLCVNCVQELVVRQDTKCPMCKQKRGPLYPVLLSGMKELTDKVNFIPGIQIQLDSD